MTQTEMMAALQSLARRTATSTTNITRVTNSTTVNQTTGFVRFDPDDEVELAADTGTGGSGTLDLTPYGVPISATKAYVRFSGIYVDAGSSSSAEIVIEVRPGTSGAFTTPINIPYDSNYDDVSNQNSEWVNLSNGAFDYQVTCSGANSEWSITLLGYEA